MAVLCNADNYENKAITEKDEEKDMSNGINKYGLSVKYGLFGLLGAPFGLFVANMLGITSSTTNYLMVAIAGGIGGAIGGWIRQGKG